MTTIGHNRRRFLSDVVALDAWHSAIRVDRNTTVVHVELTFKEGRLGGDDADLPFTFNLSLKRAVLSVALEEPLTVDRKSVARDVPITQGEQTSILSVRDQARAGLSSGVSLGISSFAASAKASGSLGREISKDEQVRFVQQLPKILVTGEPVDTQEYRWVMEASYDEFLQGSPWDPIAHPRLAARYQGDKVARLHPAIRAELSCKLADLVVTNIVPKDNSLAKKVKARITGETRIAAANQHLKKLLLNLDLEVGKMDNRFSSLIIGSVLSSSESDE